MKEPEEMTEITSENELSKLHHQDEPISIDEYVNLITDLFVEDLKKSVMIARK